MSKISKTLSAEEVQSLVAESKARLDAETSQAQAKGITTRERPAGTGWCGYSDCSHISHKHFNEAAKAAEPAT